MAMHWAKQKEGPPKVHTGQSKDALLLLSTELNILIEKLIDQEADIPHEEDRNIVACYIEDLRNFRDIVNESLDEYSALIHQ